ncbi:MAG: hypothetical protein JNJ88_08260 [Planctomycetes bacterium]|nr:hypothetical protein [Planctomycetota bacterium]
MRILDDSTRPRRVLLYSGHRIDAPNRKSPRFPAQLEPTVRAMLSRHLDRWNIGPGDLALGSGANGGDILVLELCRERGADIQVLLPFSEAEFLRRSVCVEGTAWESRFSELRKEGRWLTLAERSGPPLEGEPFGQTNLWIIETARVLAPEGPFYALLVWDEKGQGDGPGGTADFVARASELGAEIAIVNPTKLLHPGE